MPLYNIPNATSGIDQIIVDTAGEIPIIIPMLLVFVFFVVLLGGTNAQRKRTGYSDFPLWATISSLATLLVSLPLTLTTGLIQIEILGVVVVITLLSGLWLFMTRNRFEV